MISHLWLIIALLTAILMVYIGIKTHLTPKEIILELLVFVVIPAIVTFLLT